MSNTDLTLQFISDDDLLILLTMWESGDKLKASIRLRNYLLDKWRVSVTEAYHILLNVAKEFNL